MSRIRVLVVDDSSFIRKALLRIFDSEPSIEVVGIARDGSECLEKTALLRPDVITLDVMMPVMNGIETLSALMERTPTPVLMLSELTKDGADLTFRALEMGAMDFIDKSLAGYMDFFSLAGEIIAKVRAMAGKRPFAVSSGKNGAVPVKGRGVMDVVALGASTGGPPALQVILERLPHDIGFGLLIVQHMPSGFTGPLAKRLDGVCSIKVCEAGGGEEVAPGVALIAPAGLHMTVGEDRRVRVGTEPLDAVHRPSVDVLFASVGRRFKERAMGVLLTGMGTDGVKGLGVIKENGGVAIAQDEGTSVIFGMPKAAIEKGFADRVVSVTDMAMEIMRLA